MLAKDLRKEDYKMKIDIEILRKKLNGKIQAENKNGKMICEMNGSPIALALMIASIEDKVMEVHNMSEEEWQDTMEIAKDFVRTLGEYEFEKVEVMGEENENK